LFSSDSAISRLGTIKNDTFASNGNLNNTIEKDIHIQNGIIGTGGSTGVPPEPSTQIHFESGNTYISKGDYDNAIAEYTQAIRINPNYAVAITGRGFSYLRNGDNDSAIDDYSQGIRLYLSWSHAYNNRGVAYHRKGDYDSAIVDYTQAIRIDPNYARAYYNRGVAYSKKDDTTRANEDFSKAREMGHIPQDVNGQAKEEL
jgi:tetratricopeptide (TPR) repeat protein